MKERGEQGKRTQGNGERAGGRPAGARERERKREDVNFLAVRSFVRSTKCECIIHGLQGTLIFCRGRVVGRGGPLGGRRFHGRGKRVAHGGSVHEHRTQLEGEPERATGGHRETEKASRDLAREKERRKERERVGESRLFRIYTHVQPRASSFRDFYLLFRATPVILTSGRRGFQAAGEKTAGRGAEKRVSDFPRLRREGGRGAGKCTRLRNRRALTNNQIYRRSHLIFRASVGDECNDVIPRPGNYGRRAKFNVDACLVSSREIHDKALNRGAGK